MIDISANSHALGVRFTPVSLPAEFTTFEFATCSPPQLTEFGSAVDERMRKLWVANM